MALADSWRRLTHWRGQILDILVFVVNFFVAERLTSLLQYLGGGFNSNNDHIARQFGWFIVSLFAIYSLGAWLKGPGLQKRLAHDVSGGLVFIWGVLHYALTLIALTLIAASLNLDTEKPGRICGIFILAAIPTYFVGRAVVAPSQILAAVRRHWLVELLADVLLMSAITIFSMIWGLWLAGIFSAHTNGETLGLKIFSLFMAAFAFGLFYLTPRFIYLAEDYRNKWTWATIGLAMLPLVLRIFLGRAPDVLDWFV